MNTFPLEMGLWKLDMDLDIDLQPHGGGGSSCGHEDLDSASGARVWTGTGFGALHVQEPVEELERVSITSTKHKLLVFVPWGAPDLCCKLEYVGSIPRCSLPRGSATRTPGAPDTSMLVRQLRPPCTVAGTVVATHTLAGGTHVVGVRVMARGPARFRNVSVALMDGAGIVRSAFVVEDAGASMHKSQPRVWMLSGHGSMFASQDHGLLQVLGRVPEWEPVQSITICVAGPARDVHVLCDVLSMTSAS